MNLRLHVEIVHGADLFVVLPLDRGSGAAAFAGIAGKAAGEAGTVRAIDEDRKMAYLANGISRERPESFEDDE